MRKPSVKILFSTLDKREKFLNERYPDRQRTSTDGVSLTKTNIILVTNLVVKVYRRNNVKQLIN